MTFDPALLASGIAILVLLMLSAFFSGSETGLTAVSRARMHALEKDGDRRALRVVDLLQTPDKLIGAILLGNNAVNITASALATALFLELFGDAGVVYATFAMTAIVLIFSEVLPKTYAIANPDRVALTVAWPISWLVRIFYPIVAAVRWVVQGVLRALGVKTAGHLISPFEEIRGAIDLHHQEGAVEKEDRDRLGGLLDLHNLWVADVMVHRKNMATLSIDLPAEEVVRAALAARYTRIPLWRTTPDEIVGVLHAKDLSRAIMEARGDVAGLDLVKIAREPWFVPETKSLGEQLEDFRAKREHFALVVDEYGVLMGLVTLEDILEEIVGDIDDEFDQPVKGLKPVGEGAWLIDGAVPIRDVNRALDWNLPDEEAVTIAGLVIHEAKVIPERGQVFSFYGRRFEITERKRNQIMQMRVSIIRERDEDAPG